MSTISELSQQQQEHLRKYLPVEESARTHSERPFVTLTYACSLDGQISISPGVRTTLSGSETKSMTHYLRLKHDAILVGAGTVEADDPSLNCRYPGVTLATQPRPILVDPGQRIQLQSTAVYRLSERSQGKTPWVLARESDKSISTDTTLVIQSNSNTPLDWLQMLKAIKERGIDSIMIEGGARIINDLLLKPELVDAVIITVAPTWLGQGGVHVSPAPQSDKQVRHNAATLVHTSWMQFGQDAVLCGRLCSSSSLST